MTRIEQNVLDQGLLA